MKTDFSNGQGLKGKTICIALEDADYFRFSLHIKYQNQSFSYPTEQDKIFFSERNIFLAMF